MFSVAGLVFVITALMQFYLSTFPYFRQKNSNIPKIKKLDSEENSSGRKSDSR